MLIPNRTPLQVNTGSAVPAVNTDSPFGRQRLR
jgi:hypothetical protein